MIYINAVCITILSPVELKGLSSGMKGGVENRPRQSELTYYLPVSFFSFFIFKGQHYKESKKQFQHLNQNCTDLPSQVREIVQTTGSVQSV
jgi:hypothetical protein